MEQCGWLEIIHTTPGRPVTHVEKMGLPTIPPLILSLKCAGLDCAHIRTRPCPGMYKGSETVWTNHQGSYAPHSPLDQDVLYGIIHAPSQTLQLKSLYVGAFWGQWGPVGRLHWSNATPSMRKKMQNTYPIPSIPHSIHPHSVHTPLRPYPRPFSPHTITPPLPPACTKGMHSTRSTISTLHSVHTPHIRFPPLPPACAWTTRSDGCRTDAQLCHRQPHCCSLPASASAGGMCMQKGGMSTGEWSIKQALQLEVEVGTECVGVFTAWSIKQAPQWRWRWREVGTECVGV